ncbi:MAG: TetR/AcrR family transcriptional regulator [Sphingomonas sp.]|uniref:TetR/AcrR family transcriptional regulator n=1 Tax=Sphingomonas sp. TaxID=28214 RepID=UPI0025D4FA37|nr:TetR/AcrR family transcriptional regulator [Sphingomonas sp.]MBY0283701.1 TetR/AcrR family transcriptional regulator [Sphingomonas sp.]
MTTSPRSENTRDALMDALYDLFRTRGFEGVSIGDITQRTGLGRSSLYHHFPGGKDEMALAVARSARAWLQANVVAPTLAEGDREARVDRMIAGVDQLFSGGGAPCLIAAMTMPGAPDSVRTELGSALSEWIDAVCDALIATGAEPATAHAAALAAVSRIEGALIIARATGDDAAFAAGLAEARAALVAVPITA